MRLSGLIQPAAVWEKSCRWKHHPSGDLESVFQTYIASMDSYVVLMFVEFVHVKNGMLL